VAATSQPFDPSNVPKEWRIALQALKVEEIRRVKASSETKSAAILGLAFDNDDGHTRLTRGKNFVLVGGSQDTHAVMQETAIKVNERLDKRGTRLEDIPIPELRKVFREVSESISQKR